MIAWQRLTVPTEFPKAEMSSVTILTFALEAREPGGPSGMAVLCHDARYASALWKGDDRVTRLHLSPAEWRLVTVEILSLASGVAGVGPTIQRVLTEGRANVRCTEIVERRANPSALVGELDALLRPRPVGAAHRKEPL